MIEIGQTLKDRFLLEKELGRGGMGAVYSATDQVLARSVAIKLLKEQSGEEVGKRLRLEAQIAARLLHDNVVRIYDFDQAEGSWYLVMEQVDGTSYLKRWRALPLAERLRILAQVADALDYAHHQGVIHRDIKPGNVLLTSNDSPKLSDFGLSLLAEQADESGTIRGTPNYMSPEQAKGKRLDYRTDLYSLGVMLYESATGSVPFTGTATSVMSQHANMPPEPPSRRNPEISKTLEQLILRLMAKKPTDRLPSGAATAQAIRDEIDRLQGDGDPGAATAATAEEVLDVPAGPDLAALAKLGQGSVETPVVKQRTVVVPTPPPVSAADLVASPLVRKMLRKVNEEPVILSADERYLTGYYLAYLLVASRRAGIFQRRSLDRRNADRARFMLAMAYALSCGPTEEAIQEAAQLIDDQIEIRPALSPVLVAKYLAWRDTPQHRRLFRQTRQAIQELSTRAKDKSMLDAKGMLNPGLMPTSLEDLRKIAPSRSLVDDELVERWNRLADVWREVPEFRAAALKYVSGQAYRDPASPALWPEVVYPLIELARLQRRSRSPLQSVWDGVIGRVFRRADPGAELDRMLTRAVPARVVAQIDDSVKLLAKKAPDLDDDNDDDAPARDATARLGASLKDAAVDMSELTLNESQNDQEVVSLASPDPVRFLQGQLHELWKQAIAALQAQARPGPPNQPRPGAGAHLPVGPYRVVVIASLRGRSAGQVAIQGMANKQVEISTPALRTAGSSGKPILAVWVYRDNSLVLTHLDFQGTQRYVLWHAPRAHQLKFDDPDELLNELETLGMELPDQLDAALSRRFRPSGG